MQKNDIITNSTCASSPYKAPPLNTQTGDPTPSQRSAGSTTELRQHAFVEAHELVELFLDDARPKNSLDDYRNTLAATIIVYGFINPTKVGISRGRFSENEVIGNIKREVTNIDLVVLEIPKEIQWLSKVGLIVYKKQTKLYSLTSDPEKIQDKGLSECLRLVLALYEKFGPKKTEGKTSAKNVKNPTPDIATTNQKNSQTLHQPPQTPQGAAVEDLITPQDKYRELMIKICAEIQDVVCYFDDNQARICSLTKELQMIVEMDQCETDMSQHTGPLTNFDSVILRVEEDFKKKRIKHRKRLEGGNPYAFLRPAKRVSKDRIANKATDIYLREFVMPIIDGCYAQARRLTALFDQLTIATNKCLEFGVLTSEHVSTHTSDIKSFLGELFNLETIDCCGKAVNTLSKFDVAVGPWKPLIENMVTTYINRLTS